MSVSQDSLVPAGAVDPIDVVDAVGAVDPVEKAEVPVTIDADAGATLDAPVDTFGADQDRDDPDSSLAPLSEQELTGAVEAVLLVVDSPVTETALAQAAGVPVERVASVLRAVAGRLTAEGSGIDLRQTGGGWRFYTRDVFAPVVERFVLDGAQGRLSRAALETLAVIAYRQPVTRSRIAGIRGVNVDGVVRTLTSRGMVEEAGADPETGAMRYVTTELFLDRLGLTGLDELPSLGPLLPDIDGYDDE